MDFVAEVSKREWKLVKGYVALMVQNDQQQLTRDFVEMFQTAEPSEAKKKLSARIFKVGTTKTADGGIIGIGNTVRVSNLPYNGKDVCLPEIKPFLFKTKRFQMDVGVLFQTGDESITGCYGEVVGFNNKDKTINVRVYYHHKPIFATSFGKHSKFLPHPAFPSHNKTYINKVDTFPRRFVFRVGAGRLMKRALSLLEATIPRAFVGKAAVPIPQDISGGYTTTDTEAFADEPVKRRTTAMPPPSKKLKKATIEVLSETEEDAAALFNSETDTTLV